MINDLGALARAIEELPTLPPVARAKAAKALAGEAKRLLGLAHREAVFEASRDRPYPEVAAELGVSRAAINVAVTQHYAALRAAGPAQGATI